MSQATEVINVRITAAQKALIDSAAKLLGKSRTAFILDLAVRHAFTQALDAPVRPDPALVRLLNTPAPWET